MRLRNFLYLLFIIVGTLFSVTVQSQSITLAPPLSSTTYVSSMTLSYSIAGDASAQKLVITATLTSSGYWKDSVGAQWVFTKATPPLTGSQTLTFATSSLVGFTCNRSGPMKEGAYSFYATYTRPVLAGSLLVTTTTRTNVYLDVETLPPAIIFPKENSRVTNGFMLLDTVPEFYLAGSKKIAFSGPDSGLIVLLDSKLRDTVDFNTVAIDSSKSFRTTTNAFQSVTGSKRLADGNYTFRLYYNDRFSHDSSVIVRRFTVDSQSEPPLIVFPQRLGIISKQLPIRFTIPEEGAVNSLKLIIKEGTSIDTVKLKSSAAGTRQITLNTSNISASTDVTSSSIDSLKPGIYSFSLIYQDSLLNPQVLSAVVDSVLLDNETQSPSMISPTSDSSSYVGTVPVQFQLPELPSSGSTVLIVSGSNGSCELKVVADSAGVYDFSLNTADLKSTVGVLASTWRVLPDGDYTIQVRYADSAGNSFRLSNLSNFKIDTKIVRPELQLPGNSSEYRKFIDVSFMLPKLAKNNRATLRFLGCSNVDVVLKTNATGLQSYKLNGTNLAGDTSVASATSNKIPDGVYTVLVIYEDALGNGTAVDMQSNVTIKGVSPLKASITNLTGEVVISCTIPSIRLLAGGGASYIWRSGGDLLGMDTVLMVSKPGTYTLVARDGEQSDSTSIGITETTVGKQVWYKDTDNDGYSDGITTISCLQPAGYKAAASLTGLIGDCNDNAASINPAAQEICGDQIDNNCNGQTDENCAGSTATCNPTIDDSYEPNGLFSTAASISLQTPVLASLKDSKDVDYFRFRPTVSGTYQVDLQTTNGSGAVFEIYLTANQKLTPTLQSATSKQYRLNANTTYVLRVADAATANGYCYKTTVYMPTGSVFQTTDPSSANINLSNTSSSTPSSFCVVASPNPTTRGFEIFVSGASSAEPLRVRLTNSKGTQLYTFKTPASGSPVRFGSDLPVGIYFAEISQKNSSKTIKLVKQ